PETPTGPTGIRTWRRSRHERLGRAAYRIPAVDPPLLETASTHRASWKDRLLRHGEADRRGRDLHPELDEGRRRLGEVAGTASSPRSRALPAGRRCIHHVAAKEGRLL